MSGGPWQAPRTAYLLTAATAENDGEGGDAIWAALDDRGQADVLTALGAQARLAIRDALAQLGETSLGNMGSLARVGMEICAEAMNGFTALLSDPRPGDPPWEPHPCPHCRKFTAMTLTAVIYRISELTGTSAEILAHACRRAAAGTAG